MKKPMVRKGEEISTYTRNIVYGMDLDFYTPYDEVYDIAEHFLDKELHLGQLAYDQKLKHPYANLELVRNGLTFGDMPTWEMSFSTKVDFEIETDIET